MKGVVRAGKFSEATGTASFEELTAKFRRVLDSGSRPKAMLDFFTRELRRSVPRYTWVGIYAVEGDTLVLRSWSGPAATRHTRIPIGQGICGLAARTSEPVVVPDVSRDSRYLECFPSTKSEIVVPVLREGRLVGEIDIDSDELNAFSETDLGFLERLAGDIATLV